MSDHFDADDVRTDLTDIYVFASATPGRTVLIACCNPEPEEGAVNFDPEASYELKLDIDGDALPDVAFHVVFEASGQDATATVYRATGLEARAAGRVGEVIVERAPVSGDPDVRIAAGGAYRFFAGVRSDPHFKDIVGFRNGFQFTGVDPISKRNVFGIALEVPNEVLGGSGPVRFWARTVAPVEGQLVQVDQAGRPGVNNLFNRDEVDNAAF